jgi:hypothetical protein
MPPLAPGQVPVLVDVVDGASDVFILNADDLRFEVGRDRSVRKSSVPNLHACVSPCVLQFPPGRHFVGFPKPGAPRRLEYDQIDVGQGPLVYRRDLGRHEPLGAGAIVGMMGATFGGLALTVGSILLPIGLAEEDNDLALAGEVNLIVGLGLTTLGIIGIVMDPIIEQEGSSVQFPMQ